MTLRDIDHYLKLKARADHEATPAPERDVAKRQMEALEAEHPDISLRAAAVEAALNHTPSIEDFFPRSAPHRESPAGAKPTQNPFAAFVDGLFRGAANDFANTVAGEVTGAQRHDALRPEQVVTRRMSCGKGQVCIEVRANRKDMRRRALREQVMDRIEEMLQE